jgi:threonine synthase
LTRGRKGLQLEGDPRQRRTRPGRQSVIIEEPIAFESTNRRAEAVGFREALLKGLAPDRGLFMPRRIPRLSPEEIDAFAALDYPAIAAVVCGKFLRGHFPADKLAELARDAYDFPVPLEHVERRVHVMRLDRGPTASFKDFAARLMARWIQYYLGLENRRLIILTATSGDTGSAIANAFHGLPSIRVLVLFPEKEVTPRQRKQMTTLGGNVEIVAVDGKFDHCQALVKEAFSDPGLAHLPLSSANSINIGRLLPQAVYYFYAHARLRRVPDEPVVFSVPSGNFGDMMGGMLAARMGLPVRRLVIATNANDEFPRYLAGGAYAPIDPSRNCISSAMNVGHPSNLARLVALYGGAMDEKGAILKAADMERMRRELFAVTIDDAATRRTIRAAYRKHGLLLEPHGAVGWAGLREYLRREKPAPDLLCVSLETAHPAKFPEEIRELLGFDPPLPPGLEGIENKEESYRRLGAGYPEFASFLRREYS